MYMCIYMCPHYVYMYMYMTIGEVRTQSCSRRGSWIPVYTLGYKHNLNHRIIQNYKNGIQIHKELCMYIYIYVYIYTHIIYIYIHIHDVGSSSVHQFLQPEHHKHAEPPSIETTRPRAHYTHSHREETLRGTLARQPGGTEFTKEMIPKNFSSRRPDQVPFQHNFLKLLRGGDDSFYSQRFEKTEKIFLSVVVIHPHVVSLDLYCGASRNGNHISQLD